MYFNWNESTSTQLANNHLNTIEESFMRIPETDSLFMNDLRSFLHECIYEFTRLNLNVNRELYYELKQGLILNQKVYLFRKWRLKLSIKLLTVAHRRASLNLKTSSHLPQPQSQLGFVKFLEKNCVNFLLFIKKFKNERPIFNCFNDLELVDFIL